MYRVNWRIRHWRELCTSVLLYLLGYIAHFFHHFFGSTGRRYEKYESFLIILIFLEGQLRINREMKGEYNILRNELRLNKMYNSLKGS